MTYQQTPDFLFTQLPLYQNIGTDAYKPGLGNTLALDEYFGHPHQKFRTVHVAGTNGKGSVSHITAAILQKAGYKVIVAEDANFRDPESIVVQFNWTELDLGSRALRVWVGYGAGNARFATQGVIYDGDKEIATFSQRRISALDTQKYEKLVAKGINNVVGDVAKLILAM